MKFADLGLSDELLSAVIDSGYDEPTPIQAQAIPPVLMMKDIIGIAQTGTGKTASFVLPMIDILAEGRSRARMPRSLILEPTRELAAQVAENFEKYGKNHKLSMALLIGGVSMGDQVKALEKGVDVLIATPGRLMDLFGRGNVLLNGCDLLVIDEADRMLDMGFIPDIEEICTKLPSNRQTLLFSATMPPPIKKLADKFLTSPKHIEVSRPATASNLIEQKLINVAPRAKEKILVDLLDRELVNTAIIFCNRKTVVRDLAKSLKHQGFDAGEIHGDMDQASRLKELERFKDGTINLLVASDVAARGLDVKGVSHVFNYDAPNHPDDYVHRIGRTGRAGAKGKAFTFVTRADSEALDNIESLIGSKIEVEKFTGASSGAKKQGQSEKKPYSAKKQDSDKRTKSASKVEADEREESQGGESKQHNKPKRSDANEDSAPRQDTSSRDKVDAKHEKPAKKPAKKQPNSEAKDDDDDWNGPMPSFLSVGFKS